MLSLLLFLFRFFSPILFSTFLLLSIIQELSNQMANNITSWCCVASSSTCPSTRLLFTRPSANMRQLFVRFALNALVSMRVLCSSCLSQG